MNYPVRQTLLSFSFDQGEVWGLGVVSQSPQATHVACSSGGVQIQAAWLQSQYSASRVFIIRW